MLLSGDVEVLESDAGILAVNFDGSFDMLYVPSPAGLSLPPQEIHAAARKENITVSTLKRFMNPPSSFVVQIKDDIL
jgi:hypothetical protein